MARLTMSPIFAGISGKAADAVFASWKGRTYVRKHVVPANPNTIAQQAVRESMGRLSPLWRSLSVIIIAAQNVYATARSISGWNWFTKNNRVLEQSYDTKELTPPNTVIAKPTIFALADGGGGAIDVTWSGSSEGADKFILVYYRRIETAEEQAAFTPDSVDVVLASANAHTINVGANKEYMVVLMIHDTTTDGIAQSVADSIALGA